MGTLTSQRVQDTLDRLFPERQFYYRSNGVVRFITLRKPAQISALAAAILLTGWMAFTTVEVVLRDQIIESKNDRIREVTTAYDALTRRSLETEQRFLTIAGEVEAQHRQLLALVDYRSRLERDIQDMKAAVDRTMSERDDARGAADGLRVRMIGVERQLAAAVSTADGLARSLADAQRSTVALTWARDAAIAENRTLAGHVTELAAALRGAVTAEATAKTQLAENRAQLTQIGREHAATVARNADLDRQVVDLAARTIATTGRATDLQRDLGQIEEQAAKVGTERDEAIRSRDFMAKLVDDLQYRLADLKESQVDLVMRLRDRADASVAAAEAVVRHTGLNIDQLLSNAPGNDAQGGIGGPFVPLAYAGRGLGETRDAFFDAVVAVEQRLDRWNDMGLLLAALPLSAPVDNYSLSSPFGSRIDPFTRKPAFHEGLDFAGPLNTPIRAPAAGVVTRVGYWGSYGLMVEIDHGFGITSRYGHLAKTALKKGQSVAFRQELGAMGRSGRTTGPHLHYEVLFDGEPIDPANFLKAGRNVFKVGD